MRSFKVATYNIWNKNFHWEKRKKLIIQELERVDPDLIAFQEAFQDQGGNTTHSIAEALRGYRFFFWPEKRKAEKTSGIATLSKFPVKNSYLLRLSRDPNDNLDSGNKLFGCIRVSVDSRRTLFFGNTWLSISERAQVRTSLEIKEFLEKDLAVNNHIVIIAGDMNNVNSKPIDILRQIGKGMESAQIQLDSKLAEVITWPTSAEMFRKSWEEKHPDRKMDFNIVPRQVDHILISSNPSYTIVNTSIFGNIPSSTGLYPSDHFGLVCELELC